MPKIKTAVIFIPNQINHWNMFLPLVEPLRERSFHCSFVHLDQYLLKTGVLPKQDQLKGVDIWTPKIHRKLKNASSPELFHHYYRWVLPEWCRFLREQDRGVLVSAQDQQVKIRLLYEKGKGLGWRSVVFQDGYFSKMPRPWGWDGEPFLKQLKKKLLLRTPFHRFLSLSFGAASEYLGLYGVSALERYRKAGIFSGKSLRVVGSTRHAVFRERVAIKSCSKGETSTIHLLFLPRTFRIGGDHLYSYQDKVLDWLISTKRDLEKKLRTKAILHIKVKEEKDIHADYYKRISNGADIKFWSGYYCFEDLLALADVSFSCGSSSALDVAVCNKPVIQIMPGPLERAGLAIPDIPTTTEREGLALLTEEALTDGMAFCKKRQAYVHRELADADPSWDSKAQCVDWLMSIIAPSADHTMNHY